MAPRDMYSHDPIKPRLVLGFVANTVSGGGDGLFVIIPTFDPQKRWGPCPFTPHQNSWPAAGTQCVVAFPEGPGGNDMPWVIAWLGPWTPTIACTC